jgi:hypothetical protein
MLLGTFGDYPRLAGAPTDAGQCVDTRHCSQADQAGIKSEVDFPYEIQLGKMSSVQYQR